MSKRRIAPWLLALVLLIPAPAAWAQGACCTFDSCLPAADVAECSGFNGTFLDGEDCGTDPCAPAACCDGLTCGIADAFSCVTAGRQYAGAGVTCLDDPCAAGVGACCQNGACTDDSPENCSADGGSWLGAGTNCTQGPCELGSCCSPGVCDNEALHECNADQGTFIPGGDCVTDPVPCGVDNDCALNSLASQSPDNPNGYTAYTSEGGANLQRWENYSGAVGAIETLKWWGFDVDLVGSNFVECVEPDNTFLISFHEDVAGLPGNTVCSYVVPVASTPSPVDFGNYQLNEYSVTLPTPCVLIDGWLSVKGLGNTECWFAWLSAFVGDSISYCDHCQVPIEPDDLSFCAGGSKGGVFGACCDQSTGGCTNDVEIQTCAATGQRFADDTSCAELDPPCAATTGGCCFGDGNCFDDLPNSCEAGGGDWLGANVSCDFCPAVGACCFTEDNCSLETEEVCNDVGFTFVGVGASCEECPATPECAPESLFAQSPNDPDDFVAGTSEYASVFTRWEDFTGVAGAIDSLQWWGVDLEPIGGNNFIECVEGTTDFRITFHEDAGGVPGPEVCSYELTSTYAPTGIKYLGTTLNEYSVTLPTPCVVINGWVSIVGLGDPTCWFLWMSSNMFGDHWCEGCIPNEQDFDVNACFGGIAGGLFGACCDEASVACDDDVEIIGCLDPQQRFLPDQACDALDPPCGTILGACCAADASCSIDEAVDCSLGNWLGAHTLCDQCPCITPCPPGGMIEGEPACGENYEDDFNGGCTTPAANFSPIALGDTVCGQSGMFFDGGPDAVPDTDWYQLTVTQAMELSWSAKAQFRPRLWIFDAAGGCPGTALATNTVFECEDVTISAEIEPGNYWLVVYPNGWTDTAACPSGYTATITGTPLGLELLLDDETLEWNAQTATARYDVVRGDLGKLRGSSGDFTFATEECVANNLGNDFIAYPAVPLPGEGFWFVVRTVEIAGNGTYDSTGAGQVAPRDTEIDASALACP